MGRTNDNPTVKEFQQNTQALRVVNSFCRGSVKSNCRGNEESITSSISTETNTHLPRRKSRKRQYEENCHSVPETNDTSRGNF